jgi:hypothetical protein
MMSLEIKKSSFFGNLNFLTGVKWFQGVIHLNPSIPLGYD